MPAETSIALTVEENGKPLADAVVDVTAYPEKKTTTDTTDASGRCTLTAPNERTARLRVRVSKDGYVPRVITWSTDNPEFQWPKTFTLPLEKARPIGGLVTDEAGQPLAGVTLLLTMRGSDFGLSQEIHDDLWEQKVTTDDAGRWQFEGASPTLNRFHVRLIHPRFVAPEAGPNALKPEDYYALTARFVMHPGRVIKGTVRDQNGAPLAGVAVLMNQHGSGSMTQPDFTTDDAGRYTITNAPERTPGLMQDGVLLTYFKSGFAPEMQIVRTEAKPVTADVVLPPGRRLAGRVVDSDGRPLADVHVAPNYWRNMRPFVMRFQTDADGRFAWPDAPADEVTFDLLKDGQLPLRNVPSPQEKKPP